MVIGTVGSEGAVRIGWVTVGVCPVDGDVPVVVDGTIVCPLEVEDVGSLCTGVTVGLEITGLLAG